MSKAIITTSWDDGHPLDLKLAKLLKKYHIPATFYIPIKNNEREVLSSAQIRTLDKSFDIGGHTENHIMLNRVALKQAKKQITTGKEKLENILGHSVDIFSYPGGFYNHQVTELVEDAGFIAARTTRLLVTGNSKRYEMGTTVHAQNHSLSRYLQDAFYSGNLNLFLQYYKRGAYDDWLKLARESLNYIASRGGVWHLWGHSWEIEENNEWGKLESIFRSINEVTTKNKDVKLMTNTEIIRQTDEVKKKAYQKINCKRYDKRFQSIPFYEEEEFKLYQRLTANLPLQFTILDVGCGPGRLVRAFPKQKYWGLDDNRQFIRYANKWYGQKDRIFLELDYLRDLTQLTKEKFDLILLIGTLESSFSPVKEALDFLDKTTPKGKIIFTCWNKWNILARLLNYWMQRKNKNKSYYRTYFSAREIKDRLKEVAVKNSLGYIITSKWVIPPELTDKLLKKLPNFSAKLFQILFTFLETTNYKLNLNLGIDLVIILSNDRRKN